MAATAAATAAMFPNGLGCPEPMASLAGMMHLRNALVTARCLYYVLQYSWISLVIDIVGSHWKLGGLALIQFAIEINMDRVRSTEVLAIKFLHYGA